MTISTLATQISNKKYTLSCLGDSQSNLSNGYGVLSSQMWGPNFTKKLTKVGALIRGRAFGVSGQSTGEYLNRVDVLRIREEPDLVVIYGGVNDTESSQIPALTPSATGGSIVSTGQYFAVGLQYNFLDGSIMALPLQAVLIPSGSAGSIGVGAVTFPSTQASITVYVNPTGYASSAAAIAAGNRLCRLQSTFTATGGTITSLSTSAAQMPTATTQAMVQGLIKAVKFGVVGFGAGLKQSNYVLTPSALPQFGFPGMCAVVLDDVSLTGGLAATTSDLHSTITGNYSAAPVQSVWECRTPQGGELGWGRVGIAGTATFAGCCPRIIVLNTNYLNFTSGGDNYNTATGNSFIVGTSTDSGTAGTQMAGNLLERQMTAAACTAEGIPLSDIFTFQSKLIAAGETVQGGSSWHAITNNQHHNAYGNDTVARCLLATFLAQSGWLAALQT